MGSQLKICEKTKTRSIFSQVSRKSYNIFAII